MTCKIPHDGEDDLPKFLCAVCNPRKAQPPIAEAVAPVAVSPYAGKIWKHQLGKLKKEEKRLRTLADEIGNRDRAALNRVYTALKVVEKDIDRHMAKKP